MGRSILVVVMVVSACAFMPGVLPAQEIELDPTSERTVEVVAVYLGASWCTPCVLDDTKQAVRDVLMAAEEAAAERNLHFHAVGASLDEDWREGISLLESTAEFDEVMSGGHWSNTGAVSYLWAEEGVVPGVPQVVIFTRAVTRSESGFKVEDRHEFVRLAGVNQMREWTEAGGVVF